MLTSLDRRSVLLDKKRIPTDRRDVERRFDRPKGARVRFLKFASNCLAANLAQNAYFDDRQSFYRQILRKSPASPPKTVAFLFEAPRVPAVLKTDVKGARVRFLKFAFNRFALNLAQNACFRNLPKFKP